MGKLPEESTNLSLTSRGNVMNKQEKLELFEKWLDGKTILCRELGIDGKWTKIHYPFWDFEKFEFKVQEFQIDWSKMPDGTVIKIFTSDGGYAYRHLCKANSTKDRLAYYASGASKNTNRSQIIYSSKDERAELAPKHRQLIMPFFPEGCPVDPNVEVEYFLKIGTIGISKASELDWTWDPCNYDVIAFRIIRFLDVA